MSRELLKSMLDNLVRDNKEAATLDFQAYSKSKMQDIAGIDPDNYSAPEDIDTEVTDDEPSIEQMLADLEASTASE